jgi:hypothetical protein
MSLPTLPLAIAGLVFLSTLSDGASAQTTERASVGSFGEANEGSAAAAISADGRFVAFASAASNLVSGDTNNWTDIFVRDLQTGITERVSVDSNGIEGRFASFAPLISADGRFVTFDSSSPNLVPGDTNWKYDVFVHDRLMHTTERVSVSSNGDEADFNCKQTSISADGRYVTFYSRSRTLVIGPSGGTEHIFLHDRKTHVTELITVDPMGDPAGGPAYSSVISPDGRYVAFQSWGKNLIPNDNNFTSDVFVRDRMLGITEIVSLSSSGSPGDFASGGRPAISADGRFVAFQSEATILVPGDNNGQRDIFIHDRELHTTERVSLDSLGSEVNGGSSGPYLSADARYVTFQSLASNLVAGDSNLVYDIFVRDRLTGTTQRVSLDSNGIEGNDGSTNPSISANGQFVAFDSNASNLVSGDTNGFSDVFVRDRTTGSELNTIILTSSFHAPVLSPLDLAWFGAPPNSNYWLAYSKFSNGSIIGGHEFNLGAPYVIAATGVNSSDGTGSHSSIPIPSSAAGITIFIELGAQDGNGNLYDSTLQAVKFY